jgi:hypothetical protein
MKHAAQVSQPAVLTFAAQTSSGGVTLQKPKTIDFSIGAKAYKKSQTRASFMRGLFIASMIAITFAVIIGGIGLYINYKFAGRALPLTYIGGLRVGGLTQAEIKTALDKRAETITITLIDGGLVRTVTPAQFSAQFDTAAASTEATATGFKPFAFLQKRQIDVPVTVNEKQVEGYVTVEVASMQTKPENAKIVKEKGKLVLQSEIAGFRSESAFLAKRIGYLLGSMDDPVINVNTITQKPQIYASDLADDFEKANALLKTNIALQYGGTTFRPTEKQKLEWLKLNEVSGTKDLNIEFSKGLVRQYVVDMTKKFQPAAPTDPSAPLPQSLAFINIDEVVTQLQNALQNGNATTARLQTQAPQVSTVNP